MSAQPLGRGQRQREAVTAIERALTAIERGEVVGIERAAARFEQLNVLEAYEEVPRLLRAVATALAQRDPSGVRAELDALERVLGPGPIAARVAQLRDDLS